MREITPMWCTAHTRRSSPAATIGTPDQMEDVESEGDAALPGIKSYGWIDSQKRPQDTRSWLQRFGPRRPRSGWSRINTLGAERLIEAGRMKPAGLREVAAARKDGRWQRAYDSPSAATIPADFLQELSRDKKAQSFFEGLNRANVYAIAYRLQTARKPETREKRLRSILAMLARGESFH